jgi:hypothetical protein
MVNRQGVVGCVVDPLAGIARRSLAWIGDVALVTGLILLAVVVLRKAFGPTVTFHPEASLSNALQVDTAMVVLNATVATLLSASYFVISWAVLGGSPGQLVLGMRVRGESPGATLSLGQAITRWILLFPPFATLSVVTVRAPALGTLIWAGAVAWYLVLLVTTSRSASRQGLHDRVTGSVVHQRLREDRRRMPEVAADVR